MSAWKRCVQCLEVYPVEQSDVMCPRCEAGICVDCLDKHYTADDKVVCGFCDEEFSLQSP